MDGGFTPRGRDLGMWLYRAGPPPAEEHHDGPEDQHHQAPDEVDVDAQRAIVDRLISDQIDVNTRQTMRNRGIADQAEDGQQDAEGDEQHADREADIK